MAQDILWNGLTYQQTIDDKIFYHTLETVATPTSDPNFVPTIVSEFNPQQYVNSPTTAVSSLNNLFANTTVLMQAQYNAIPGAPAFTQPATSAADFLAQFNSFNLPATWDNFVSALAAYTTPKLPNGFNLPANTTLTSVLTQTDVQNLLNAFVSDYKYALRFPTSYSNGGGVDSSEWDSIIRGLANATTTSPDGIPTNTDLQNAYNMLTASMESQFKSAFADYLQNYPYTQVQKTIVVGGQSQTVDSGVQNPVLPQDLGLNFQKYLIASATLQPGTFPAQPTGTPNVSYGPAYQSYQSIYQSFYPPQAGDLSSATTTYNLNYQNLLNSFLNSEIPKFNQTVAAGDDLSSAFIPSRLFGDFADYVKRNFQTNSSSSSIPSASIAPLLDQEYQTLLGQLGGSTPVSWLPAALTNALPAQNLTQDLSNQIQYAFYQLAPAPSTQLQTPNPSISPAVIGAALYIRSVMQNTNVSFVQALQQLSSTNVSALPAAAIAVLNSLGVNTTNQISPYQLSLITYAINNPNDTTIPSSVAAVAAALRQQGTQIVLNAVLNDPSTLWTGNIAGAQSGSGGPSSVDLDGSGRKLAILDNIFLLIVQLIGTLQNVAAAQSQRLTFLSQWQSAYVSLQNQIHSFYKGNGDFVDGSGAKSGDKVYSPDWYVKGADSAGCGDLTRSNNVRDALNNTINANLTQVIQNNRGQVSDTAKAMQSTVNTTSDAVNQQSNMATTILQQLESLLNAIFK
jgi:hypothetical protein